MNQIGFLLGGIGLLCAFLAWAFVRARRKIRDGMARMQAVTIFRAPARISLKRTEPFKWNKGQRAEQRVAAFRALGLVDVCGFTVSREATSRMFLLRHPVTGLLGIVQERDPAGTWSDVAFFQSGSSQPIYASNVLKKEHFFLFPGDPKIHLPDVTEAELVTSVWKAIEPGATSANVAAENAAAMLEEAYAAAADARLLRPLEDFELRRLLKEKKMSCEDEEVSDVVFQRIKAEIPSVIGGELRLACRDQFLREGGISAREWQQAKERLLIVHDRTPLHELGKRVDRVMLSLPEFCRPEMRKRLDASAKTSGPPRAIFAELNAALPTWERYKKLGEVSRPVPADIYCAPLLQQST